MMSKLENVASEFRKVSTAQMSATAQRTVRENVSLSSHVTMLSEKVNTLSKENGDVREKCRKQEAKISMMEQEQSVMVRKNAHRFQNSLINCQQKS